MVQQKPYLGFYRRGAVMLKQKGDAGAGELYTK